MVLKGITIDKKPLKEHLEVIGHRDACEYVLQLAKDTTPLSERVIKELHSLVLIDKPQDRGIYRSVPVRILELMQAGYPPINVKFIDRKRYYDSFNSYYETSTDY